MLTVVMNEIARWFSRAIVMCEVTRLHVPRTRDGSDRRIEREVIDEGSDVRGRAIACTSRAILMVVIRVSHARLSIRVVMCKVARLHVLRARY